MNKRANRVYWLLLIMILIMGVCILADDKRGQSPEDTEDTTQQITTQSFTEPSTESSTELTSSDETVETTTADEAMLENYYKNTVFTGDSIMSGFATFVQNTSGDAPKWLKQCTFITAVSWGIDDALKGSGPMYNGKAQDITLSLGSIKPEKVFINLGINEMNGLGSPGYSIEKLNGKYGELIARIKSAVPESKIYVMSVPPCTAAKQTNMFNNETIRKFNRSVEEKAEEWGITYLDFSAEFGQALAPEYARDGIHHQPKAFREVWIPYLEKIAANNV